MTELCSNTEKLSTTDILNLFSFNINVTFVWYFGHLCCKKTIPLKHISLIWFCLVVVRCRITGPGGYSLRTERAKLVTDCVGNAQIFVSKIPKVVCVSNQS